ncbi:MAG TPA: NTF2-like N-terminal transpeptidase domain-containing protein [Thermodesulfobacteriota bacterium]|nr:NTF2-like N-terminal transpeptidase domain-containing protein [Thermodesulfobacteriota bacterium]
MKRALLVFIAVCWMGALVTGCSHNTGGPTELLNKFFSSAVKQDYATTYTCYYEAYQAKVSKEEFVRHRKEASVLQSYKIISITMPDNNSAEADVQLTFGPSEKLNRKEPVTVNLKEAMVKEKGEWKIKVW